MIKHLTLVLGLILSSSALANDAQSIKDSLESTIADDNDLSAVVVMLPLNKKDLDTSHELVEFSYDTIPHRINVVLKDKKSGKQENLKAKFDEAIFIPATTGLVSKGEVIDQSKLTDLKLPKTRHTQGIASQASDVIGKVAKKNIHADKPINLSDVMTPVIIDKGSKIKMVYSKNNIKIETDGFALESGGIGETIKARNAESNKNIHGKILDSKTIEVHN